MLRTIGTIFLLCVVCSASANQADEIHDRRATYLDGALYAGIGLPYLVTLGVMITPRWRNFDYAPIAQLELHTSIITTQGNVMFGVQKINSGVYRSVLFGYHSGDAGLVERSSSWNGFTVRYLQSTPIHDSAYFTRFWAVDLDYRRETRADDRGKISLLPAIHFGWTFAPF